MNSNELHSSPASDAFDDLSRSGTIDHKFAHAQPFRHLVTSVFSDVLLSLQPNTKGPKDRLHILEVGCGTGVWIEEIDQLLKQQDQPHSLYGFDLSTEMVQHAQSRMQALDVTAQIETGNALEKSSYVFHGESRFDVIYTYDVVQQVPVGEQYTLILLMLEHVKPGGALIVFDNEAQSEFGRKMAFKKFLRKYLFLPTVPGYFCHAKYPKLEVIGQTLRNDGFENSIHVKNGMHKRAMVCLKPISSN